MTNKSVENGREYEEKAKIILENKGFKIVKHCSKEKWSSCYDLLCEKDSKGYQVEVRGISTNLKIFNIHYEKIRELLKYENLWFLLLNKSGHCFTKINKNILIDEKQEIKGWKIKLKREPKEYHFDYTSPKNQRWTYKVRKAGGSLYFLIPKFDRQLMGVNCGDMIDMDIIGVKKANKK